MRRQAAHQFEEKSLAWTGHYVDILKREQFAPEYLKLDPKHVVPTLVHDGHVIRESILICEYLDEVTEARPSSRRSWTTFLLARSPSLL